MSFLSGRWGMKVEIILKATRHNNCNKQVDVPPDEKRWTSPLGIADANNTPAVLHAA